MLALMAAATEALTATSYRAEAHAIAAAKVDGALDAAVVRAVLGVSDIRPQSRWRIDGQPRRFWFEGLPVDVTAQGERGRIDLNASDGPLIRQLLIGNGASPETATQITDGILAWRSATGLGGVHGNGNDPYAVAGAAYRPRHGPFQTVAELRLVSGVTQDLFARIAPALTVYSKRSGFDETIAPREALRATHPNDEQKIDDILQQRGTGAGLDGGSTALPTASAPFSLAGQAVSIDATVSIGERTFHRRAVVELTGSDARPYYTLAWN
ncbi:MAG TPA: hypothetical protein VMF58_13850 [Rhizomicrobium sp.]|nr:hypothetical protein [Rhizomicrobium sp.]